VLAAENGVEAGQGDAGDAVRDHLGTVLVGRPVAWAAARLFPVGEVTDRATTVSGNEEA